MRLARPDRQPQDDASAHAQQEDRMFQKDLLDLLILLDLYVLLLQLDLLVLYFLLTQLDL